jgi:hypothetical protein
MTSRWWIRTGPISGQRRVATSAAWGDQIRPWAVHGRCRGCTGWSVAEGVGSLEVEGPQLLSSLSRSNGGDGLSGGVWEVGAGWWSVGGNLGGIGPWLLPLPYWHPWLCGGHAQQGGKWWWEGRPRRPSGLGFSSNPPPPSRCKEAGSSGTWCPHLVVAAWRMHITASAALRRPLA